MARRSLAAALLMLGLFASFARAQASDGAGEPAYTTANLTTAEPAGARLAPPVPPNAWTAPKLHLSLAAGFATLQALDVVTTLRGVRMGSVSEANPMMGGLAQHPSALVGVKAGLTAATIMSMHNLSKTHPKAAAITMMLLNAGSAFVVQSNLRLVTTR
jgi:hypothetical protein